MVVANCAYFEHQPFTTQAADAHGAAFNNCRAWGDAVVLNLAAGRQHSIVNSSLYSNAHVMIGTIGTGCIGSEKVVSRNNVFHGDPMYGDPGENVALYYAAGSDGDGAGPCGTAPFDNADSIVATVKETDLCPNANHVLCVDPQFQGPLSGDQFNLLPLASSPAKDRSGQLVGSTVADSHVVPATDIRGYTRPSGTITWGAYELSPTSTTPPTDPSGGGSAGGSTGSGGGTGSGTSGTSDAVGGHGCGLGGTLALCSGLLMFCLRRRRG